MEHIFIPMMSLFHPSLVRQQLSQTFPKIIILHPKTEIRRKLVRIHRAEQRAFVRTGFDKRIWQPFSGGSIDHHPALSQDLRMSIALELVDKSCHLQIVNISIFIAQILVPFFITACTDCNELHLRELSRQLEILLRTLASIPSGNETNRRSGGFL